MRRGRRSALCEEGREEVAGFMEEEVGKDEEECPKLFVIVIVAVLRM